eukprot:3363752-Pyramimonas_sp.AAC.1
MPVPCCAAERLLEVSLHVCQEESISLPPRAWPDIFSPAGCGGRNWIVKANVSALIDKLMPFASCDIMYAWASHTAGPPAVGSGSEASLTSNGASSHSGLAV